YNPWVHRDGRILHKVQGSGTDRRRLPRSPYIVLPRRSVGLEEDMLTDATLNNMTRKTKWVDQVQRVDRIPVPSWIELSLTELCNRSEGHPRACAFCPRADASVYPNQSLHMS